MGAPEQANSGHSATAMADASIGLDAFGASTPGPLAWQNWVSRLNMWSSGHRLF
jgi:hypothetical protein